MKINSSTFQFDRSSSDYKEIESILIKVAQQNHIDDVSEIALSLNPNSGIVQFKTAVEADYNGATEDPNTLSTQEQNQQSVPTTPAISSSDIQSGADKGVNPVFNKDKEPAGPASPTQHPQPAQTNQPTDNEPGSVGNEDELETKQDEMGASTEEKESPTPVSEDEAKKMMEKMQKEYAEKQKQNQEQGSPDWLNELKAMPVKKPAQ